MKKLLFILVVIVSLKNLMAQDLKIDERKKIDKEELQNKREGNFVTGIPRLGSDPINGQGIGADLFIYANGKKSDPLFEYTPYRSKIEIHTFLTNKDEKEATVTLDIPYIFNSTWRIRFEGGYEDNPNLLYFGKTAETLGTLNHMGDSFGKYSDYLNSLKKTRAGIGDEDALVTDELYNTYRKEETIINLSAENAYWDGTLRLLIGLEAALVDITTFDGKTLSGDSTSQGQSLLSEESAQGEILGMGKNLVNIVQFGMIYDTRDFEPDPTKGIFMELTDEFSSKGLGSKFNFNKIYFHLNYYKRFLSQYFDRLVFASRYGVSLTEGSAPFYEYQDSWGSEGSIEGLGGLGTLRGYKQSRFLAPLVSFINFEARFRFASTSFWGQHLSFNVVPFFDMGKVWNNIGDYSFNNYKTSQGLGIRVPWNQSTILSFDYATSSEDEQFFFSYGNIF